MGNKKLIVTLAAVIALSMAGIVNAATNAITFDPTGAGGTGVQAALFDWAPGNALSIDLTNSGGLQNGDNLQVLFQANLGVVKDGDGNIVAVNGFGGSKFFTAVAGYQETGTLTGPVSAQFDLTPNTPSFFYIYANNSNSSDLDGTGFTSGTIVMTATILPEMFSSAFNYTINPATGLPYAPTNLDNFGTDNYPGVLSVVGGGDTSIHGQITSVDPGYFPDLTPGTMFDITLFSTQQKVPYDQANPSAVFSSDGIANGDVVGVAGVGPVNGLFQGNTNKFMFQADANQSFATPTIPEPTTLLLLGVGILGLAGLKKRIF